MFFSLTKKLTISSEYSRLHGKKTAFFVILLAASNERRMFRFWAPISHLGLTAFWIFAMISLTSSIWWGASLGMSLKLKHEDNHSPHFSCVQIYSGEVVRL